MQILNIEPNPEDEYFEDAELEAADEEVEAKLGPEPLLNRIANHKSFKSIIAVMAIYTLVLIGDTIGALVSLNDSEPLEYGQGITTTTACDSDGINVSAIGRTETPESNLEFLLDGIRLSGVSDKCINRIFKIMIYDEDGKVVNLGFHNMTGTPRTGTDAEFARVYISRQSIDAPGLDWLVYPASSFPNPPSAGGLSLCGGDFDLSDQINYNFGSSVPKPGCPTENYLTNWRGFITVPGDDDGEEYDVDFSLALTGQAVLTIDDENVIVSRGRSNERTVTGTTKLLKGLAYPFNLWLFSGSGENKVNLNWDQTGGSTVPASAFQYESGLSVKISPREGSTDYTVTSTSSTANDRNFTLRFNRPIPSDQAKRFTIETSRR
jgi:hypothetical protein